MKDAIRKNIKRSKKFYQRKKENTFLAMTKVKNRDTSNKNRVVSNASWIIGCKLVKAVLTLIVTMLTARFLGPTNYGVVNYAASLVTFVTPLMKLGLDSVLVHEVVIHPNQEGESLGTAIVFSLISGFLCIVGVVSFALIVNTDDTTKILVCAIYSLVLLFQAVELIQYWFHAKLMAKYISTAMLISYAIVSAIQITLLGLGASIYLITFAMIMDYLIISLILLLQYRRKGTQELSFSWQRGKEMLSESKHFILSSMMVVIFSRTDTIMISLMIGDAATGYYSAATTCASMTSFVFAAIMDSFRPVIYEKLDKNDQEGYERNISLLYSVVTYLSLLQSLCMTIFAGFIIHILYGSAYSAAVPALQIVVWYTTFSYFGSVRNIWILGEGKQNYLWRINLLGAIANVALNFVLIPLCGIVGAAIASLFTQFFTNVIVGFIFKPIRYNNKLMFQGLNPKNITYLIKRVLSR